MSQGDSEHNHWVFQNPAMYRFLRGVVNGGRFITPVADYLQAQPSESVLDVGCGVGEFSRVVPGRYEGFDLNERFVRYARRKFGNGQKQFFCRNALAMAEEKKSYDKGILVNLLHHFDNAELDRLLRGLKSLVEKYFVIVDADWDASNRFQRWLLQKDQGSFLRPRKELTARLEQHFVVLDFDLFRSRSGSVQLFRCRGVPKNAA